MNFTPKQRFNSFIEARNPRERVVLFVAMVILITYGWGMLFFSAMFRSNVDLTARIDDMRVTIATQNTRIAELNALISGDPDSPARVRQRQLMQANSEADERLRQLYGQLIDPRKMAQMLAGILQRDTTLVLVSLENVAPELLHGSGTNQQATGGGNLDLYKHGLHMVFDGSFMETVRYLRSLEQLEEDFYWENLEFNVQDYPTARISLDIYTLSTQREWIGV